MHNLYLMYVYLRVFFFFMYLFIFLKGLFKKLTAFTMTQPVHTTETVVYYCIIKMVAFRKICVALKRAVLFYQTATACSLLAAGVLGDSLGAFRDSVLGQFTGQEKTDCSLDFSAGDG